MLFRDIHLMAISIFYILSSAQSQRKYKSIFTKIYYLENTNSLSVLKCISIERVSIWKQMLEKRYLQTNDSSDMFIHVT